MIPRATITAPLWQRLCAWLHWRPRRKRCQMCERYLTLAGISNKNARRLFHEAHLYVDRVHAQIALKTMRASAIQKDNAFTEEMQLRIAEIERKLAEARKRCDTN